MGLGKTIQVLALLATATGSPPGQGPVAGGRPSLTGLQLGPGGRQVHPPAPGARLHRPRPPRLRETFSEYDLIITTYGTVRTDIAELTKFEFDYAILDEAQAIKNSESQSAKAARLFRAASSWRSAALRSKTTWASSGRSSSS